MAKYAYEEAERILNSPVTGHPSRYLEERVIRLEKALREVIKESKTTGCRC
ncbi:hypothetical protein [uncultured Tenacibaculum sp.]|uniref:hypothetical protein n=1 Tax=uncultured Tenacibaculum sp. TaxID=174713 RepID=UPI002622F97E|nr:hypothetical protein [uncultured Tenacibaculum sp.]